MLFRRSLLLTCMLGLAVVSACTTTSDGDPLPANSSATRPSSDNGEELPFAGAPKVNDPLDTSRYEQDPCRSLTADQAKGLNLPSTGKIDNDVSLGIGCEWQNSTTRGYVEIVFIVDDPRGLSPEYENKKDFEFFDVLSDIEGYPAVARGNDDRDTGRCTVVVGVADDMAFETILRLSPANVGNIEPCEKAAEVAGLAVQTMKEGA